LEFASGGEPLSHSEGFSFLFSFIGGRSRRINGVELGSKSGPQANCPTILFGENIILTLQIVLKKKYIGKVRAKIENINLIFEGVEILIKKFWVNKWFSHTVKSTTLPYCD
jgi:hypothetical protein